MNSSSRAYSGFLAITARPALLAAAIAMSGCSSTSDVKPKLFSPPDSLSNAVLPASARSPSAMEAISRGVAAVTPPGAALKDVYYNFDSVHLETEAQEILLKNAKWLQTNPTARVEIEGVGAFTR